MSVAALERPATNAIATSTTPSIRAENIEAVGRHAIRYGLVVTLAWIGAMKFTAYEAEGISGLVSNSPLMSWAYQVFSTRQFGVVLGVTELVIAGLIAARPLSAKVSAIGSVLAAGMFLTTLSFMLSTPGVVEPSLGFPALSVLPGQFLVKDIVLLSAAVWATGEALSAAKRNRLLGASALKGYDPVAYFTEGVPTQGHVDITSTYAGKTYHFASTHHKEMFDTEPQKYLPQYDGFCAFGVSVGQLFDVDPRTGQVINGKLYLNLNRKILKDFNKDATALIAEADMKWPEVMRTA